MENRVHSRLSLWLGITLFVVATFAVLAGSYLYYRAETERIQKEKYEEIAAIGKLKAGQIRQWRQNQLEDVGAVAKGPMFKRAINEWLRGPANSVAHQDLTDRLVTIQQARGYSDASLLDLNGRVLLSATGQTEPISASEEKAVQYAIANRSSMLTDLHRTPSSAVSIAAAAPLPDPEGRPIAVVLLRSNPESVLFPLIQSWPTPNRSAETLLVRRDGEEVLFLNELRHRSESALSLRNPIAHQDLPAAQAVLGKEGIFRGKDYRGVEVLADLRAIPDSPWFMVAKVDASEILAEAHYRAGMVALFAVLFIVLAAGVTAYGYRYRQVRLYRDLYHSEQEQQAGLREFRTTLYSIGDAVITTDAEGRIKQMNPTAERLTGWSEVEAQGKPLSSVFRIVNEKKRADVEDPVARVLRQGIVVGLANHTLLIAKDGSERPIADSGAPIFDQGGSITGVVLVFQDQTEERRQVRERETRLALLQMLNEHSDTHELIRNITGFLQERSGCEAVGVRLKEGDDFPYFETRGFSQEFVRAENNLCERDLNGQLVRDAVGNPVLECMCGNVLCGRFDPTLPFFTAKGSFWTNSSSELLANTTEADRQGRTRNRCNGEGYESVGLFRLRSGDETIGLLQLNDRAKGRFTPELLDFMESTADEIAIALAQRQALARLRESENKFSKAFRASPDAVVISRRDDGLIIETNEKWESTFGYKREDVIGRRSLEIGLLENPEDRYRAIALLQEQGFVRDFETNIRKTSGEIRQTLLSAESIEINSEPCILTIIRDVTASKRAEATLRTSEAQLANAVRMARLGHWEYDVAQDLFTFNDHFYEIYRTTADQVGGYTMSSAEYSRRFVHPDDVDTVTDEIRKSIETTDPHFSQQLEHRMLYADGEVGHVAVRIFVVKDDSGRTVRTYGVNQDITERKKAEQAIRDSEERYRSLFDNMLEGLAYCRVLFEDGQPQDFIYLDVNDAFYGLTGLMNVIGRKVSEVIPGMRESNRELLEVYGRVSLTGIAEKFETYIDSLGIWFSISVFSTEREHFVAVFDNITDRKQAEQALQESEERFRTLTDGAFEGVVISRDGVILDCNHVFCQMAGYELQELIGMNIRDLTAPEFRDVTLTHVLSGSEEAYESALLRKDGKVIPELVKGKTIPYEGGTARIASIRDISAVRKAEEVQRRLATAIEQSAEAVLITDTKGVIQYVNPALERNSGFSREDLLGKTPRIFQSGEHDAAFYRQLWATINAGNIWSGRFVNKRRDGSSFQEEATISPVRSASGEITNFVAVKRDITEHLELSNQLFQAQKMEAVGTLAGGVAHDFNNLLQVVLGYSELILFDQNLPSRFRDDLERINQAARNGADLVHRLLTFSRKTEVKSRPLNLNRRIEQFRKMLSRTIPKMIEIDLVLTDELCPINADPSQMEQILMNLALNARDAMPEGGRLVIETKNVTLDEQYCKTHLEAKPGRYVLLSVSDTGQGMDKETLQHIFEPFFTTKRPGEGTGLGLAMVYGIVKQHGGQIICYSEPAEGTTFKIYFPALVSGEESQKAEPKTLPRGGSETILIVDDEEMIRDLGARIVTRAGYRAITASNGREALEIYRARQAEIALVILDLIMHEMGGKQCLKGLLSLNPSAKVVIASGYSASDSIKEALSSGAKGFINKPYDIGQVLEVVRSVLDDNIS